MTDKKTSIPATVTETLYFRCSALPRLELCAGSLQAARVLKDTGGAMADAGQAVHGALLDVCRVPGNMKSAAAIKEAAEAKADALALDGRASSVLVWFARVVQSVAEAGGGVTQWDEPVLDGIDFSVECGRPVVLQGTPDVRFTTADGVRHVFEFKTGAAMTETADTHLQGQSYVAIESAQSRAESVRLHVLAAGNRRGEQHTFCDYDAPALEGVIFRIGAVLRTAVAPDAPRCVSEAACRYCKAAGTFRCPESCAAVDKFSGNVIKLADPVAVFMALPPEERAAVLDRALLVAKIADKIKSAAKEAVRQDPAAIPGYFIKPGAKTSEIPDVQAAFAVLQERAGMAQADFLPALSMSIGKTVEAFHAFRMRLWERAPDATREAKPPTKKSSDETCRAMLKPCIVEGVKDGSLDHE